MGKILLLAGVVLAVMVVWRWLKSRDREDGVRKPRAGRSRRGALTQDMEPCPACGTFVPVGTGACGRPECPATGRRG
ncbi:MAG: hypothetical protein AB7R90_16040 [Reyranellaceae bacterium]